MSELVVGAEQALGQVLLAMHQVLEATVADALPQSMLLGSASTTALNDLDVPDTLRQRLEWEAATEDRRVRGLAAQLHASLAELRTALTLLGGGVEEGGRLLDIPVSALDREIDMLATENAALGMQMVRLYDEAQGVAQQLMAEITQRRVPAL